MSARPARIVVIGGGPAGLMAAEALAVAGHTVTLCDAMPSVGRKFLLAGIGGLNLTHSEEPDRFKQRYGPRREVLAPMLDEFGAQALQDWAAKLGIATFTGSSGRVFPVGMKAAPLLRAWLHRLREAGVRILVRHRWLGWGPNGWGAGEPLRFATTDGEIKLPADALVLALGGASWARLGSDGAWVPWLASRGVDIAPLRPANCGFDVARPGTDGEIGWSAHFCERFAGQALKSIAAGFVAADGETQHRIGECIVTRSGLEGSLIYALSAPLRDLIETRGSATIRIDLAPGRTLERLQSDLARPRGSRSLASHLQSKAGIDGLKAGLLREYASADDLASASRLARLIKNLPVELRAPRPLDEAISTAGGVRFEALDDNLMLKALPGVFCCGEMLDWEAPTGGYLLTGCFTTGRAAGLGTARWLARSRLCT
ncbi:MAG: TIGR03862 family flavoprotein [Zoogloeaceae bacterium]|nr:TIGR03862 family flavoprotein [Zoogloeaceae bacterium]